MVESSRHTGEIIHDPIRGSASKRIIINSDVFNEGGYTFPTAEDYQREVGQSLSLLQDKQWGFGHMIPQMRLRIESIPLSPRCWIDMPYIKGIPLSETPSSDISPDIKQQLAIFLSKCQHMAAATSEEFGIPILPDLLNGVQKPHSYFGNFIIGKDGLLYFVDAYPLAVISKKHSGKYKKGLRTASKRLSSPDITAATESLCQVV